MTLEEALELGRAWPDWECAGTFAAIVIAERGELGLTELRFGCAPLGADGKLLSDYWVKWVPDFRDPGVLGHALDQVRRAWGNPGMARVLFCAALVEGGFAVRMITSVMGTRVERPLPGMAFDDPHATEAEALLAARRAAP